MAASGAGDHGVSCEQCGAPLHRDQRYCLGCGARVGGRSAQLQEIVRRARESPAPGPVAAQPAALAAGALPPPAGGDAAERRRRSPGSVLAGFSALTLPSPRISTLLVLAFAGFGVLLGSVAGAPAGTSLAASVRPHVKLLLPAATTTSATGSGEGSSVQPPAVSEQATPEAAPITAPAEVAAAPARTPASAPSTPKKATGKTKGAAAPSPPAAKLPKITHVFVIMLSDQPYAATFGPESKAPYLARTLERRGELLPRYYAVAHEQLANGIALVSGQGPTPSTAANCPLYADVAPATIGGDGQVAGDGCVYPLTTPTLPGQLEVKQLTWRAYVQGIDEGAGGPPACAHPVLGQGDPAPAQPPSGGAYATFRNPFVYFHGLTDSPTCASNDVGLSALNSDLSSARRTPSLAYIVPDRCHDGSAGPCPGGGPGGLPAADGWLGQVVPQILASPAYKKGGLLVITTDEAPTSGEFADSSSCCGQPRYPDLPARSGVAASLPPEGGGQVGALLLSPFVKAHTVSQAPYNHYSLLRTIEDLFGLKHLGYANAAHLESLQPSLFAVKAGR